MVLLTLFINDGVYACDGNFCRYDVEGWCTDRGALATWNLGRESINQSKPDNLIHTDVALMTCAFHPEHPVSFVRLKHVIVGHLSIGMRSFIYQWNGHSILISLLQALIASGSFNGDLYIWDLSQEGDMQRGRSDALCDLRHQEPILSIVWQYSFTEAGKYGNRCALDLSLH